MRYCPNCETEKDASAEKCDNCRSKYNMPNIYCCLEECNQHMWCKYCTNGINLKKKESE